MPITIARKNKDTGEVTYIDYNTVAERLAEFWKDHNDWRIKTRVVEAAKLVRVRTVIRDQNGNVVATGTAEEDREYGYINKTSALENAETSSVGRALAILGYAGSEIASAEEIVVADEAQIRRQEWDNAKATMQATLEHYDTVVAIKKAIADGAPKLVVEAWHELPKEAKAALWRAPSKGGPFTTAERDYFKSSEYFSARKAYYNLPEDHDTQSSVAATQPTMPAGVDNDEGEDNV